MFRDLGIDQFVAISLKRCESTMLVIAHQAAVDGDIGSEDWSQPPFDSKMQRLRPFELCAAVIDY